MYIRQKNIYRAKNKASKKSPLKILLKSLSMRTDPGPCEYEARVLSLHQSGTWEIKFETAIHLAKAVKIDDVFLKSKWEEFGYSFLIIINI